MKLRSGKDWHPSEEAIEEWKGAYKDVDVEQELKKMAVWCDKDPDSLRAKTLDMQLGDVTWIVDPQELMQFKQYLLNAYGYYYDGEIRYE